MPVIGRRPSVFVRETGECGFILSEHTQRNRGELRLYESSDTDSQMRFICRETPWSRERILWFGVTLEGGTPETPKITPVLVFDRDSEKATLPQSVHYLRNVIDPTATYNEVLQEVSLWWWENRYTPISGTDEIQRIVFDPTDPPATGSYNLTVLFNQTSSIEFTQGDPATNAQAMQEAIRTAANNTEIYVVTETALSYLVVFTGSLGEKNITLIEAVPDSIDATITVEVVREGKQPSTLKDLAVEREIPIEEVPRPPDREPHAEPVLKAGQATHEVGDPPADLGLGVPGVLNQFELTDTLQMGGLAEAKNRDPFQETSSHLTIPPSPGLISLSAVKSAAERVTIQTLSEEELQAHASHLYQQREMQDLVLSTRVLKYATGQIQLLTSQESEPDTSGDLSASSGLVIGGGELRTAMETQLYEGFNAVSVSEGSAFLSIFIVLPSWYTLDTGVTGHTFLVTGGTGPYLWFVREVANAAPVEDGTEYTGPDGNSVPAGEDQVFGGGLPQGMFLHQSGLLHGIPETFGTHIFRLKVVDSQGNQAEQTVHLDVFESDLSFVPYSGQIDPPCYQAPSTEVPLTIVSFQPPTITTENADGYTFQFEAVNGIGNQKWSIADVYEGNDFPTEAPSDSVLGGSRPLSVSMDELGLLTVSPDVLDDQGVWLFQVQVEDSQRCTRVDVTLVIDTQVVEGQPNVQPGIALVPPEGSPGTYRRQHLILNYPQTVSSETTVSNSYLRGPRPYNLAGFDGVVLSSGPISSFVPGVINTAGVVRAVDSSEGFFEPQLAGGVPHLDWVTSNPTDFFDRVEDKQDPSNDNFTSPPPYPNPLNKDMQQEIRLTPEAEAGRPLSGDLHITVDGASTGVFQSYDEENPALFGDGLQTGLESILGVGDSIEVTSFSAFQYNVLFTGEDYGNRTLPNIIVTPSAGLEGNVTVEVETIQEANFLPPVPPTESSIDEQTPAGKRFRPLWPI